MIITVKKSAIEDTQFRIHMFRCLTRKGLEHWTKDGTIQFRPDYELTFIYKRNARLVKQLIAKEFDINPEVFV